MKLNNMSKSPQRQGRWFEPSTIGGMSPVGKVVAYAVLAFWSFIVLFPIYWLCITAFKAMDDVNFGPFYIPWVDFTPSLHAWRNIIVDDMADTFSAYFNSIVISFFSTIFCVVVGSLAAYALVRIQYRPRFGSILLFALTIAGACVAIGRWGIDWWLGIAVGLAIFFFLWRAAIKERFNNGQMSVVVGIFLIK